MIGLSSPGHLSGARNREITLAPRRAGPRAHGVRPALGLRREGGARLLLHGGGGERLDAACAPPPSEYSHRARCEDSEVTKSPLPEPYAKTLAPKGNEKSIRQNEHPDRFGQRPRWRECLLSVTIRERISR